MPGSRRSRPACRRTAKIGAFPACAGRRSRCSPVRVDYYTRLERGTLGGVSESVLEALAQALQLDEAEHAPLFDLARAANEAMELPADPGQTLLVYTAEPGSPSEDGLNLLASWAATLDQPETEGHHQHADTAQATHDQGTGRDVQR